MFHLLKSILNASVHLEKIDTSDHLDTSSEKVEKKKKGAPNCIICKAKFADEQSLTNHIQKKHKRKTVNDCVHCYKSFSSCKSLNIHTDREYYDLKSYGHKYPCSTCDLTFTSTDLLEDHEWMHMQSQNLFDHEEPKPVHKSERISERKESDMKVK